MREVIYRIVQGHAQIKSRDIISLSALWDFLVSSFLHLSLEHRSFGTWTGYRCLAIVGYLMAGYISDL